MKSVINAPWNKNQKEFSKQVGDYKIHFIYELSHSKLILNTSNEYNSLSHYEMTQHFIGWNSKHV